MAQGGTRSGAAVVYTWAGPTVGLSTEGQADRVRRYCETQGWAIVGEVAARRFPDLVELARVAVERQAEVVVLAAEALDDLKHRYAEAWDTLRSRLAVHQIVVVGVPFAP